MLAFKILFLISNILHTTTSKELHGESAIYFIAVV